jgi:hypothetical protein
MQASHLHIDTFGLSWQTQEAFGVLSPDELNGDLVSSQQVRRQVQCPALPVRPKCPFNADKSKIDRSQDSRWDSINCTSTCSRTVQLGVLAKFITSKPENMSVVRLQHLINSARRIHDKSLSCRREDVVALRPLPFPSACRTPSPAVEGGRARLSRCLPGCLPDAMSNTGSFSSHTSIVLGEARPFWDQACRVSQVVPTADS